MVSSVSSAYLFAASDKLKGGRCPGFLEGVINLRMGDGEMGVKIVGIRGN